jgi:4-alpha-glucanotransferase
VLELRDGLRLPGMKVLHFAWGEFDGSNLFLPHNYPVNCVVYSGTHDNNTTVGWYHEETGEAIRDHIRQYLGHEIGEINWDFIRLGMASVAHTFLVTMQDVLGLGSEARMNTPGRQAGNWGWRMQPGDFDNPVADRLAHLAYIYRRSLETSAPPS